MSFKEYLIETYGYNEPILISEIAVAGMTGNALRQYFKRLVKSGELMRYDTGIYYLPKASRLLEQSYLDPLKVINRKYIQTPSETYGYYAGAFFANQLGLTTQMPSVIEIVTEKESTKGRTISIGTQTVRLKRPQVTITSENASLLQFLDAVAQAEKYSELSPAETYSTLKDYAKKQYFSQEQLTNTLPAISGQTAKKLIEWGLVYEFTS